VRLRVAVEFSTVTELFYRLTMKFIDEQRPVLMHRVEGTYVPISYRDLRHKVELFALGLASLGVKRGDHVALISENRPQWVTCDMGMLYLGAVNVPIYPTLTAKQIEVIFNDANIKMAIVSNQMQLNKVRKIFHDVKSLKKVVIMAESQESSQDSAVRFSDVLRAGESFEKEHPDYLSQSLKQVRPEDLLTIIYTSGTTGNPKGVMLTHANLVTNIQSSAEVIPFGPDDVLLSFLPLCHSFERMAGYYTAMSCGASVAYAESIETVRENLLEVHPTVVTTVPRLFERIYGRIKRQVDSSPRPRRKIFYWAVDVGRRYAKARRRGSISPALKVQRALADRLVYRKLCKRMGGKLKYFASGGAPLARELGEFFEAVGIQIIEGYGLTETSPVISINRLDYYRFGTVGFPIPGVEVKIAEDGEILARGPNIMKGYWNDKKATEEAIDKDGWLHTGDLGVFDAEGFLMITDRKKHLFVSSAGKNIAPAPIENLFLQSRYINQFVLIGDRRMFISALIVPDIDAIREYADKNKIEYNDTTDLTQSLEIHKLIERDIHLLQQDLANFERVRRFAILDRPLTIENGEITPTQKVRRDIVEERYRSLIDSMYQGMG
ncbi:MAG: AMP-dependent synthetase/ligase, partial [Bacteroidota bacterium]